MKQYPGTFAFQGVKLGIVDSCGFACVGCHFYTPGDADSSIVPCRAIGERDVPNCCALAANGRFLHFVEVEK
jgi:hypothetical protein